jgi:hypothetical protein
MKVAAGACEQSREAGVRFPAPAGAGLHVFDRQAERIVNTGQMLLGLGIATALLALWAAVFATRADFATRRATALATQRWEDTVRPSPRLSFTRAPAPGQAIELEVENLGGTLAAGAVIVQAGDDLYAGELTLPEHAPPRRIFLNPVLKAWQRKTQPSCLLLVGRDLSGKCWDYLDGNKAVREPRKWLPTQLRELRLQGIVDFPAVTGPAKT